MLIIFLQLFTELGPVKVTEYCSYICVMAFKSSPQGCESEISINSSLWLVVHLFSSIIYFRHSIHQAIVNDLLQEVNSYQQNPRQFFFFSL